MRSYLFFCTAGVSFDFDMLRGVLGGQKSH